MTGNLKKSKRLNHARAAKVRCDAYEQDGQARSNPDKSNKVGRLECAKNGVEMSNAYSIGKTGMESIDADAISVQRSDCIESGLGRAG